MYLLRKSNAFPRPSSVTPSFFSYPLSYMGVISQPPPPPPWCRLSIDRLPCIAAAMMPPYLEERLQFPSPRLISLPRLAGFIDRIFSPASWAPRWTSLLRRTTHWQRSGGRGSWRSWPSSSEGIRSHWCSCFYRKG